MLSGGAPALKMNLWYMEHKTKINESSLRRKYDENDAVLKRSENVNEKGWEKTKRVYLDVQNVNLALKRFRKWIERDYNLLDFHNRELIFGSAIINKCGFNDEGIVVVAKCLGA